MSRIAPDVGHPVLNPDGRKIYIPASAINQIKQLGCLRTAPSERHKPRRKRLYQIDEKIYFYLRGGKAARLFLSNSHHQPVRAMNYQRSATHRGSKNAVKLLTLLGTDCSGPSVVECNCRKCSRSAEDADRTGESFKGRKSA